MARIQLAVTGRSLFMVCGCLCVIGMAVTTLAADRGRRKPAKPWIVPSRAIKLRNPIEADTQSLTLGTKLYARECRSCHGAKGIGDGKGGTDLETPPTDLTNAAFWDQSDGALFWKIAEGRDDMPGHKEFMSEQEMWHVVNYMRTLAPRPAASLPQFEAPQAFRAAASAVLRSYYAVHAALV